MLLLMQKKMMLDNFLGSAEGFHGIVHKYYNSAAFLNEAL
jgi:hypothetical protein